MFESVEVDDLPDPLGPVDHDDWRPWDEPGYDELIDALAAADPDRERTAAELLTDAQAGRLVDLRAIDPAQLTDDEQVTLVQVAERHVSASTAVKLRAVATFAGPPPRDDVEAAADVFRFAWTEIGAALGVGEGTARRMVGNADALTRRLPATFAALLAGHISWAKALRILEATTGMSDEHCRAVEDRVLPRAGSRTHAAHSSAVGRAAHDADPDGWAARRNDRLRDVALIRESHGDGVADLIARNVDAVDADLIWTAADTWARAAKADGDQRPLDALRVAALVDLAARYLAGRPIRDDANEADQPTAAPTRHGLPVTVNVIIPLPSLVGASTAPGILAGSGDLLPPDAVADLLHAGARIRFALTDTHGNLVGISTQLHDPTSLMRVYVTLRDLTLRVPTGSTTPIAGHDLDHLHPDGPTTPANLHALSRGWHRAKTFRHWTIHPNNDHTITWTSQRTGRTYTTHPFDYRDTS